MYAATSVLARGLAAMTGTETQQRIAVLLHDDSITMISSFELNQLASLTYHEAQIVTSATPDMSNILVDCMEKICAHPAQHSPLSVHKALMMIHHLLLLGAEKIILIIANQLGKYMEGLSEYNTVLIAQQQQASPAAFFMRLKGGAVDKGMPVRELSNKVRMLLNNPTELLHRRNKAADETSLVPVGDKRQVGFATDAVRLQHLRDRLEQQHQQMTRSNLAKADNGFGAGYSAANKKNVVGAAHGIEEMIAMQRREEQAFCDSKAAAAAKLQTDAAAAAATTAAAAPPFSEYQAPSLLATSNQQQHYSAPAPAPEVDLLDFGSSTTNPAPTPPAMAQHDLLSLDAVAPQQYQQQQQYQPQQQSDPFGLNTNNNTAAAASTSTNDTADLMGLMSLGGGGRGIDNANNNPNLIGGGSGSVGINTMGGGINAMTLQQSYYGGQQQHPDPFGNGGGATPQYPPNSSTTNSNCNSNNNNNYSNNNGYNSNENGSNNNINNSNNYNNNSNGYINNNSNNSNNNSNNNNGYISSNSNSNNNNNNNSNNNNNNGYINNNSSNNNYNNSNNNNNNSNTYNENGNIMSGGGGGGVAPGHDTFSALDALSMGGRGGNTAATTTVSANNYNNNNSLYQQQQQPQQQQARGGGGGVSALSMGMPSFGSKEPTPSLNQLAANTPQYPAHTAPHLQSFVCQESSIVAPTAVTSSIQISSSSSNNYGAEDDTDFSFAMGGAIGSGMEPQGPTMAPPPPPAAW